MRLSFTPQRILRFVLLNAVFIAFLALWNGQLHRESVQLAVAKSKQMLDMPAELAGYPSGYALNTAADHIEVLTAALAQVPRAHRKKIGRAHV